MNHEIKSGPEIQSSSDAVLCETILAHGIEADVAKQSFAELFRRYQDIATAKARAAGVEPWRLDDVVAESFAKVLNAFSNGFGPSESFVAYLLTAVRTEATRVTVIERVTDAASHEEMEELTSRPESYVTFNMDERDQLSRALEQVPETGKQVLWLIEVEGLSRAETAQRLDSTVPAVTSALARARESLRAGYLQQYVATIPPSCDGYAQHLGSYTRSTLSKRLHRKLEKHIVGCADCGTQQKRLTSINVNLKSLLGPIGIGLGAATVGQLAADGATSAQAVTPAGAKGAALKGKAWAFGVTAGIVVVGLLALLLLPRVSAQQSGTPPPAGPSAPVTEDAPIELEAPQVPPPGHSTPAPQPSTGTRYAPPGGDDRTPNWEIVEDLYKDSRKDLSE